MFNYDFDEYGQKYWLCPDYPTSKECFVAPPKEYREFLSREEPFLLFGGEDYDHCVKDKVEPLYSVGVGGSYSKYANHETVNLYLAKAEIGKRKFYKVGLSVLPNPKGRDAKSYKEIVRCKSIEAGKTEHPALYEKFILWRCTEQKYENEDVFDRNIFKNFAGKSEVVHTQDPRVEAVFNSSFDRLTQYLQSHSQISAWLEAKSLQLLLKAIYDERFATARSAVEFFCCGAEIQGFNGQEKSKLVKDLWVGMPPKDVIAYEEFAINKLLPKVESAWKDLSLSDPEKRYSKAKANYEKWWARKGGSKIDFRRPRYYNW